MIKLKFEARLSRIADVQMSTRRSRSFAVVFTKHRDGKTSPEGHSFATIIRGNKRAVKKRVRQSIKDRNVK